MTATATSIVAARFVRETAAPGPGKVAVLQEAADQVRAYFAKRLRCFSLPLAFEGTPFQREVWRTVAALAFGDVVSYADVARAIGRPLAHRGVASAMRLTPIDLFVAAHRVVGADGRPRGCAPGSLRLRLLAFEREGRAHPGRGRPARTAKESS